MCYKTICEDENDRIEQLLRRITEVIYHYKDGDEYCKCSFNPYTTWNSMFEYASRLKRTRLIDLKGFEDIISSEEQKTFNEMKNNAISEKKSVMG